MNKYEVLNRVMNDLQKWDDYLKRGDHIFIEKADKENRLNDIQDWLDDKSVTEEVRKGRLDFLNFHIDATEPVFGTYNWSKTHKLVNKV